jgi:hypothetical protein
MILLNLWQPSILPPSPPAATPLPSLNLRWAVGILTAPRKQPTLPATLAALGAAGFGDCPRLISADVNLSGCWQNWLATTAALLAAYPRVDRLLILEDDCLLSAGLRRYFDLPYYLPPAAGVCSLFCSRDCLRNELLQWHRMPVPLLAHGSQAYVMTPEVARCLLADPPFRQRRDGTDHAVGTYCRLKEIPYFVHSPSLSRHSAPVDTSLVESRGLPELREATLFVEHFQFQLQEPQLYAHVQTISQPVSPLLFELPPEVAVRFEHK